MSPALHIAIPETSLAHPLNGKPYTQYHVVLQLPLRRQEIKKRYTDFSKLHQDITSQAGASPPVALPTKGWFTRTVNNDSLTEQRRVGLEQYLRAIIDSDDGKWRSSPAWRAFLELQAEMDTASFGKASSAASKAQTLDSGEWLDLHRKLKSRIQEARQQIKRRESANTAQQQHYIAAEAKATLVRAAAMVEELDAALTVMNKETGKQQQLGAGEWRRRKDLISAARKEVQALDGILRTAAQNGGSVGAPSEPASKQGEQPLFANRSKAGGRVLGGPAKETERTRELDNNGVVQLQQQIMQEQDEDVMVLGKTITKLKDMGILMNEELQIQNEMLTMIEEDVDRVQGKIDVGRKRIQKIK